MTPQAPSVGAAGSLTSGAADAVITGASIAAASLPQGVYEVLVTTYQVGTVDTNYTNMVVQKKPSGAATDLHVVPSTAVPTTIFLPRVELNGSTGLQVAADAASPGASSVYVAVITATRIG